MNMNKHRDGIVLDDPHPDSLAYRDDVVVHHSSECTMTRLGTSLAGTLKTRWANSKRKWYNDCCKGDVTMMKKESNVVEPGTWYTVLIEDIGELRIPCNYLPSIGSEVLITIETRAGKDMTTDTLKGIVIRHLSINGIGEFQETGIRL